MQTKNPVVQAQFNVVQFPVISCQRQAPQKSSLKLVNPAPNRTYPIKFCSVCSLRHCYAKTTEQRGVMLIKEAALQLEDAALGPLCWQASVRLSCVCLCVSWVTRWAPRPRGLSHPSPPGKDFSRSHDNFRGDELMLWGLCVPAPFLQTPYTTKTNLWLHFLFKTYFVSTCSS